MADPLSWAYAAGLALVAATFYNAPLKWWRARREGEIIADPVYHRANLVSVLLVTAWLVWMVWVPFDRPLLTGFPWRTMARAVALAVAWSGFLFAFWARLVMGRLFAPTLVVYGDHEVVDRGPFALVRHPFYAGLWVALCAGALVLDSAATLVVAMLMTPLIAVIARREEAHLVEELGDAYGTYMEQVPRFVPWPMRGR